MNPTLIPNSSSPPTTTSEHSTDRERFQYVVTFSLQLLFLVAGFVGFKLETPISIFIEEMKPLSTYVLEIAVSFHLFFVFVLITTTIKQPNNGAILESLVVFLMNGGISYIFVYLLDHKLAVISGIFWVCVVLLITLIKRGDVVDQLKLLKDGCFSCFSFLIVFKFLWNGLCVPVGAVIKSGWNGICVPVGAALKFLWNGMCNASRRLRDCCRRNNDDQTSQDSTNLSSPLV